MNATAPAARGPASRLEWLLCAAIAAIVIATFMGTLKAEFVNWDDPKNVYENPHLGLGAENLKWMFTDSSYVRRYMPLGWLAYSVDRTLFGGGPVSYHAGNLLLHALSALLLFGILKRLLHLAPGATDQARRSTLLICAAAGALLWAINPLRVEPVAWASARNYCVTNCLMLASVWFYLRGWTAEGGVSRRALWLSVAAYGLSAFTYPITLTAPVVFVVLDVFALKRLPLDPRRWFAAPARSVVLEKALFLIPAVLMLAATLWAKFSNGDVERIVTLGEFTVWQRLMQGFYVLAYFLWKPWMPDALAPKYATLLEVNPAAPLFLGSMLLVLAISALLWLRRREWPVLCGAWVAHLLLLVPLLGFTEHPHHTFDRYSYFQGALWSVVVAVLLWKFAQTPRWRLAASTTTACLVLFGWLTTQQVKVWNNSLALQTRMVESLGETREAALHETVRGVLLMKRGDHTLAEISFRRAIRLDSNLPEPWRNLGDLLADQRRFKDAVACYRSVLKANPADFGALLNLSAALGTAGQLDEAANELRAALRLKPDHVGAHHNLAVTLGLLGQTDEAAQHRAEAERLRAVKNGR